ncbi:MAG: hypothetical protein N3G21_10415 [Candidatus Hydrogenedentes bacterium]|nr:hypothetical protein [Candidatus Hydrogenedentota bacterium]
MKNLHYYLHELIFPTILFMCLGGMTWAVRGCSGFGGSNGCLFAGITIAVAWWFLSYTPGKNHLRSYATGWVVLAMTLGIMFSGARGWMQWPSFFEGKLLTNYPKGEFVPIPKYYGYIWLFIAGVPWAGLGACFTAWCYSEKNMSVQRWSIRIASAILGGVVAHILFTYFPSVFLPLYDSIKDRYADFANNPNLRRLINDNWNALVHLGVYLGVLCGEIFLQNRRNVKLILTVGLVNGIGWALLQNWKWADDFWQNTNFNWWRCWESSGGISIGLAYGLAYFLVNQPENRDAWIKFYNSQSLSKNEISPANKISKKESVFGERLAFFITLFWGLLLSLRNGLKGWANIYLGNEDYWDKVLWFIAVPVLILGTISIILWIKNNKHKIEPSNPFPEYVFVIWFVLILQNFIAQLITGPHSNWSEFSFAVYYILLFGICGIIVYHYQYIKKVFQQS